MEVLQRFRYRTVWMSKRHTVTIREVITVYNDMFDHMDGMIQALANKKTQWKKDLFFAVKCAWQKLSKYYTEETPKTRMLLLAVHILDPLWKLRSFRMWDKVMDINPADQTSYTTQYQVAFRKYVENEYCAKHRCLPVTTLENKLNNNFISSAIASRSGQSSYDPYDLSSDDDEYWMTDNVAKMIPRWSNRTAHLLIAARLWLNLPPELPQNRVKINPNLNAYHTDSMESSSIF